MLCCVVLCLVLRCGAVWCGVVCGVRRIEADSSKAESSTGYTGHSREQHSRAQEHSTQQSCLICLYALLLWSETEHLTYSSHTHSWQIYSQLRPFSHETNILNLSDCPSDINGSPESQYSLRGVKGVESFGRKSRLSTSDF